MNMWEIIGGVGAIVFIFVVYYVGNNLDLFGDMKRTRVNIEKINAETQKENVTLKRDILRYERERQKLLGKDIDKSLKDIDAEYTFKLEDDKY